MVDSLQDERLPVSLIFYREIPGVIDIAVADELCMKKAFEMEKLSGYGFHTLVLFDAEISDGNRLVESRFGEYNIVQARFQLDCRRGREGELVCGDWINYTLGGEQIFSGVEISLPVGINEQRKIFITNNPVGSQD